MRRSYRETMMPRSAGLRPTRQGFEHMVLPPLKEAPKLEAKPLVIKEAITKGSGGLAAVNTKFASLMPAWSAKVEEMLLELRQRQDGENVWRERKHPLEFIEERIDKQDAR